MQNIINIVNKMFVATDNLEWKELEDYFTKIITVDFSSLSGEKPTQMKAIDLINSWKLALPGFDSVHHQTGNFIVEKESEKEEYNVICYGTATRKFESDVESYVGSYNFKIVKDENNYKISSFTYNFKYHDGKDLNASAIAKVASK